MYQTLLGKEGFRKVYHLALFNLDNEVEVFFACFNCYVYVIVSHWPGLRQFFRGFTLR